MTSSAAKNIEYNENIAYDLSRFDKRKRVREALELEPVAAPRTIAKPREHAKTAAKAKTHSVSASTILGFMMVAVLMFCVVLNYMRLNEISIELSSLQSDYNQLRSEAAIMKVKREQNMNLQRIEELAKDMGMSRPTKDQIVYVEVSQSDRGVILREPEIKTDFLNGMKTFFFAAIDFFR